MDVPNEFLSELLIHQDIITVQWATRINNPYVSVKLKVGDSVFMYTWHVGRIRCHVVAIKGREQQTFDVPVDFNVLARYIESEFFHEMDYHMGGRAWDLEITNKVYYRRGLNGGILTP